MKKLFVFNIDNTIDLITNSSSELFVLNGDNYETIRDLITNIYPNYLDEYCDIVSLYDADDNDLEIYLDNIYGYYHTKENYIKFDGFSFDEIYESINSRYPNIKSHVYNDRYIFRYGFIHSHRNEINKILDPDKKIYLLFSRDENPDYEMQEKLETISSRYHLG